MTSALPEGFLPASPAHADGYRVLLMHAHPDDESIATGGTIAALTQAGAHVTVLTSTRGEMGEVIPQELRHLEQGWPKAGRSLAEGQTPVIDHGDSLAVVREEELSQALRELGASGVFLGTTPALAPGMPPQRYRDSGMAWGTDGRATAAPDSAADSFARADLEQAAQDAATLIRVLQPDVLITYAQDGGYGHPDHVKTHLLALQSAKIAALAPDAASPSWAVPLIWEIVSDRPATNSADNGSVVTVSGDAKAKRAALQAHRTQVEVAGEDFALSDNVFRTLQAEESFTASKTQVSQYRSSAAKPAPWWGAALVGAGSGILVGLIGTTLHLQGSPGLIWGAGLALLLLASVMTWLSLHYPRGLAAVICGVLCYGTVMLLSLPKPLVGLVISNLAGMVWIYGIAALTLGFVVGSILGTKLKGRRRRSEVS